MLGTCDNTRWRIDDGSAFKHRIQLRVICLDLALGFAGVGFGVADMRKRFDAGVASPVDREIAAPGRDQRQPETGERHYSRVQHRL